MNTAEAVAVALCAAAGFSAAGLPGAGAGLLIGVVLFALRWHRNPAWAWVVLYLRRNSTLMLTDPSTVANDRAIGGVRYQDGVAITAIQLLGKAYQPTRFTGSSAAVTTNILDVTATAAEISHSLGLAFESLSVVTAGSRRSADGDYSSVYDTLIGTPPYAGLREAWLVIRFRALDNGDALQIRPTVGTAALAATQRAAMALRCRGIRAKVATAADIADAETRIGVTALQQRNRHWRSVRGESCWCTTYAYRPEDITSDMLARAWSFRADAIVQTLTLLPDGTATATVTVSTPQRPGAPPSVLLRTLPGEQPQAAAGNLFGPRPLVRGLAGGPLPASLAVPIGPTGVLLGRVANGDRILLPLGDPGRQTRVHIAAHDPIVKRIIVRLAASGERVTVHTAEVARWSSVRMPRLAVVEDPRPVAGTKVSVTDGTVVVGPRPSTVISVGPPESAGSQAADILIAQIGPSIVRVTAAGQCHDVEVDLFRAENRYVAAGFAVTQ